MLYTQGTPCVNEDDFCAAHSAGNTCRNWATLPFLRLSGGQREAGHAREMNFYFHAWRFCEKGLAFFRTL